MTILVGYRSRRWTQKGRKIPITLKKKGFFLCPAGRTLKEVNDLYGHLVWNLLWLSKQDFRTHIRFFEFLGPL